MANDTKPDINSFKPNPHFSKEERKLEKVISGEVVSRTQPVGKKLLHLFFDNDIEDLKGYVIYDLIIPKIKETVWDIFDMVWMGGKHSTPSKTSNVRTGYSKMYTVGGSKPSKAIDNKGGRSRDFRELIFETRGDAEAAFDALQTIVESDYQRASIGDLYDIVGITGDFTDNKYGWYDLSGAKVKRALGGGYLIDLPPATLLD